MVGSSFYISISPVPAVQHGGFKFLYQYQSSTSRLAWWGQVFISVSVQYQSSLVGSSFYISLSPVPAVQHGGEVFILLSVQYQPSSMVGSSFYISISPVPAVQHGGVKFLYQYQSSTSRLAWWGQVLYQYQSSTSRLAWWGQFLYQYQSSTSRLAWLSQVFISVSVQYQPSSMVGSSFYISISPVPAVQHGGVKFLYQYQSSTSRLAWWGQVFISVSVQYQPSSMVGSSFYISISQYQPSSMVGSSFYITISLVPAVQHRGVKFLYQYQSSTTRLAWWDLVFISVSVEYQPSSMVWSSFISVSVQYQPSSMVGSSFYISISPVPAVQHGGVQFLYQYQSSTSRLAWWGSSFYISISPVPAVQHGGVKFLYQYQSSINRLAWWGQVFISVSVQYQSSMVGSSFYISLSPVPAVQHGGVKFLYHYQSSTSRLAWWGQVLYQYQSSTSRLAWWGQVFISVSVQYQPSSMVGSSFYISISPVTAVQHGEVKFLYQYQFSISRLAWWGQVFISVSVQYQSSSMVGSSFYITIVTVPAVQHGGSSFYITLSLVPAVQHGGVKFLYQYQYSTSRLAWWGQVFISVPVEYQQSSMVGSSFYTSISPVPAVQHGGVKFLYQYQSSTSRLAWWGQVFISVSVQYQPSSMVGSSFYVSISPVPAVQHGGVKFLYQYQSSTSRLAWMGSSDYITFSSTSRLAWWGPVFISVSVQYQPSSMVWSSFISVSVQYQSSSMVGSSFYISISQVPAVQHGWVKFLYQYQYSTSRLAWWGQVFISV